MTQTQARSQKIWLWILSAFALFVATFALLWHRGTIQAWVRAQVVHAYVKKIAPHLPFEIEEVRVEENWREFFQGRIKKLGAVLKWKEFRIRVEGPITIVFDPHRDRFDLEFHPQATIEPASKSEAVSSKFAIDLAIAGKGDFTLLHDADLSVSAAAFEWKHFGAQATSPQLSAHWHSRKLAAEVVIPSASWSPTPKKTLSLSQLKIAADTELKLKPTLLGPELHLTWTGKDLKALWNEKYLDIPLSRLPGTLTAWLDDAPRFSLRLGGARSALKLALGGKLRGPKNAPTGIDLSWETRSVPIAELVKQIASSEGKEILIPEVQIQDGVADLKGSAEIQFGEKKLPKIEGELALRRGKARWTKKLLAVGGLSLQLRFSTETGATGEIQIPTIYFRKLKASLAKTSFAANLTPPYRELRNFKLRFGNEQTIPLEVPGFEIKIGAAQGEFRFAAPKEQFTLHTSFSLKGPSIEQALRPLCLGGAKIPPVSVAIQFPSVEITQEKLDPDGHIHLETFGGTIDAEDLGVFHFDTPLPEFDGSVEIKNVQLDQLGDWSGFGEMKGIVNAYARDVTVQKWLPTHFDFNLDLLPTRGRSKIVFSTTAMRNLIALIAGPGIRQLPGIADWLMFGWIHQITGGYDIDYAGISAFSNAGGVMIETHDPKDTEGKTTAKHFIIKGYSIKIPLNSESYPVVADQTTMAIYARMMGNELAQIARNKKGKKDEKKESCLPPEF